MADREGLRLTGVYRAKVRASGLFFDKRGVLVGKHSGHEFYTLIGGGWEHGESLVETVEREFLEETGMRVSAQHLIFVGELHAGDEQVLDIVFQVLPTTSDQAPVREDSGSLIELRFIPVEALSNTNLMPQEFWRVWIPRLVSHKDEESFSYGGIYAR